MFLGSGLFDLRRLRQESIRVGLGTDVGGGTSLSLLKTMREAYKVLQLQDQVLPAGRALYLATLGAGDDDQIVEGMDALALVRQAHDRLIKQLELGSLQRIAQIADKP